MVERIGENPEPEEPEERLLREPAQRPDGIIIKLLGSYSDQVLDRVWVEASRGNHASAVAYSPDEITQLGEGDFELGLQQVGKDMYTNPLLDKFF